MQPGFAQHFIAGAHWEPAGLLFSVEAYYKNLDQVKEYTQNDIIGGGIPISRTVLAGTGVAQGVEIMALKKHGWLSGWCSFTRGRIEYTIPGINKGIAYSASHNRQNEFKIVVLADHKDWNVGLTWIYTSGANYTPIWRKPQGNPNNPVGDIRKDYVIGEKNSAQLPDYHRLDFNASRHFRLGPLQMDFGISIYNAYNHENVIRRTVFQDRDELKLKDTKMLGIIPGIYLKINYGQTP
ncbi:TonB-dependent receptor [bacterium]|nr:TonB-dependent receptor [bacterium]